MMKQKAKRVLVLFATVVALCVAVFFVRDMVCGWRVFSSAGALVMVVW